MPNEFQAVLTQAVNDLVENGFDSAERVAGWMRKLRDAAERSLVSEASLEQQLRDHLGETFRRMVDQGGLLRRHPNVPRFTYERIKPALRAELDRRIASSADLIRLNRSQAIDKTLQRFVGWSSSVPAGGTDQASRARTKKDVRKSLAQLPFEERRVIIDQGHKLVSAVSDLVATDGGAIAGRWRSHWRQSGYDYREHHKERDGGVYLVRGSWAHKAGLVRTGDAGYTDSITRPAEEPFCRCFYEWVYNIKDLPADMVTPKGREALEHARAVIRGQEARADAAAVARGDLVSIDDPEDLVRRAIAHFKPSDLEEAVDLAARADRLQYARGIKSIRHVPDRSKWHAYYDPDKDELVVEDKLFREPLLTRVQALVHEMGHRGQDVDPDTYARFKREHLNTMANFRHMANETHLDDAAIHGVHDIAEEAFAESYSRFMLNLAMPWELKQFWQERITQEAT